MGIKKEYTLFVTILMLSKLSEAIAGWGTCLLEPQYVSKWSRLIAHDASHSHATSELVIGSVPLKVEVQIKPENSKPEEDFYFLGIGSAQRDDDVNSTYGGVVYYYTGQSVEVSVPNKKDGFDSGRVIFTGGNSWTGPVQQSERSAMYRIRVWGKEHFPKPDFESQLVAMDTNTNTYKEISHGLGGEPDFALVQIKLPSGHITDAVGSSMQITSGSADWGGVIYAYNDKIFKLWAPNNAKGIFSNADGWGVKGKIEQSGSVKVYAWKVLFALKKFRQTINLPSLATMTQQIDRDHDLIDIKVNALDGSSTGFIFRASGAVQNVLANNSYGGIIFSFSDSKFRFWYPKKGSLIFVDQFWGQRNSQLNSKKVQVTVATYKHYQTCPPVVTSGPYITKQPIPTTRPPLINNQQVQTGHMISSTTQTTNNKLSKHATTAKKEFSFTDVDVTTILIGAGFGVAGSLIIFTIGCVIKVMISKPKITEVKPF